MSSRPSRSVPLQYDDGFRGLIALVISVPPLLLGVFEAWPRTESDDPDLSSLFIALCGSFILFFLVYLVWTQRLFSRTPRREMLRVAEAQHRRGSSMLSWIIGLRSAADWGVSAAVIALGVSGAAAVLGTGAGSLWLPFVVLLTVSFAWASIVYAFALRYLRLHAAGETISFDIDDEPGFSEFLSMSVMVSSVAAMSAGTPRTRAGLTAVRTHTLVSFAFNTLVLALTVALIAGVIASS